MKDCPVWVSIEELETTALMGETNAAVAAAASSEGAAAPLLLPLVLALLLE